MQAENFEHYFVFICEYCSLSDVLMNEEHTKDAMTYLGAMITGLTADYHIHFILSDSTEVFGKKTAEDENLKKILPVKNGISVGSSDMAEKIFGIDEKNSKDCEKDKGICVSDNRTRRVMFIT